MKRVTLVSLSLLLSLSLAGTAQDARPAPATVDLSALRSFKTGQDIKWDKQFQALMQSSFPQRQTFWRDHGRFQSVPELIQTFLGVPGTISLDQDRYLTVDGCVPHDGGDRGMVWIDTAPAARPPVIFVVPQTVRTDPGEKGVSLHLWFFTSAQLNWQKMPQPFAASLANWFDAYHATWAKYFNMWPVMVTIVQPTGETVDVLPAQVGLSKRAEGEQ